MEKKEMLTAEAREKLDAQVVEIATAFNSGKAGALVTAASVADLINEPYDAELPCPDVIAETCDVRKIPMGEVTEYYVQAVTTKTVYTIVNGVITQVAVSPSSSNVLSMGVYGTEDDYLTLNNLLTQKYDSIALKGVDQHEALNRKEAKDVLALFIAAAVSVGNIFVNDSGATKVSFKKLIEMRRAIDKYGKAKFVLISGSSVTTDLELLDYDDNKYREVSPAKAGIGSWIKVENYTYEHSGTQTVMPTNKAILVSTSDSMNNRPAVFARRMMGSIGGNQVERVILVDGPKKQVGATVIWGFGITTVESYGAVVTNPYCFAVYQDAAIYS